MLSTVVFATALAAASITGSGVVKTEARTVEAFSSIESGGSWAVDVVHGDKATVTVTGDDNIVALLSTTVVDGKLAIKSNSSFSTKVPLVVKVTMPSIASLKVSGSGQSSISDVKATKLGIETSGSGNVSFRGNADDIGVRASGSGQVVLFGKAKSLDVTVSGSGNVDGSALEVAVATVKASGSGNVAVHATTSLDVTVSGSGGVVYAGAPKLSKKVSGSGTVRASTDPTTKAVKDIASGVKDAVLAPPPPPPPASPKPKKGGW